MDAHTLLLSRVWGLSRAPGGASHAGALFSQPRDRQRRGAFRVGGANLFFRESFSAFSCEGIRKSEFTSPNLRPQPHLHRRTFSVIFIPPTPAAPPPSRPGPGDAGAIQLSRSIACISSGVDERPSNRLRAARRALKTGEETARSRRKSFRRSLIVI